VQERKATKNAREHDKKETSTTTTTTTPSPPPPQSKKEEDNDTKENTKETTTTQSSTASPSSPQRQNEEPDVCCICLDELPTDTTKLIRVTCCAKLWHIGCDNNVRKSKMPDDLKNRCHQCRKPFPKTDEEQVKRLREWLDKDTAWAQRMMGQWYRDGDCGLKQSYVMAAMLFEKAVAQGHPGAMNDLARLYREGQGVVQSSKKTAELCAMAAEQGHVEATYNLAYMYKEGQGVAQSYKKAVELYITAAEEGDVEAMNTLGVLYFEGHGVDQSNECAREWWIKAAHEGNEDAIANVKMLDKQKGTSTTTAPTTPASPPSVCCSSCNKPQPSGHTFRKCKGCRTVQYCNTECQRAHWSPGGHKQECKRLRKKRDREKPCKV